MPGPAAVYNMAGISPIYDNDWGADNVGVAAGVYMKAGTVLGLVTGTGTDVPEVQTVSITGSPTGGTFTLIYPAAAGSISTAPIAHNASAATVAAAVNAAFGQNVVTGGGGALPGTPVTLTFNQGPSANQRHQTLTFTHALTGGTTPTPVIAKTTPGRPAAGFFAAYNDGASDGSQVARRILMYDTTTDVFGNVTNAQSFDASGMAGSASRAVPAYYKGYFRCSELTGLDAAGVTDLGRLINAAAATESQAILCVTGA